MITLSAHARPVFRRGLELSSRCPSSAEELFRDLTRILSEFDESARRGGHSSGLVEDARYALCAWLDEMVFSSTAFSIDWLGHSLAVAQFRDQSAGANFFHRMERLHQRAEQAGVLEVHARCILLGFKGQFRLEGDDKLQSVVRDALGKNPDPRWRQPPWFQALSQGPGKRPKERTGRFLVWIGLAALVLSALTYLALAWFAQSL